MRSGLTFLFLLAGFGLAAQIFGPAAVPLDPNMVRNRDEGYFTLEASAGINFATLREPVVRWVDPGEMRWQPGLDLGLAGLLHMRRTVAVELGAHILQERGESLGYGQSSFDGLFGSGSEFDPSADRVRQGDLTFDEWWLRGQLLFRFRIGNFSINPGVGISAILSGEERFNFTQTTNVIYDNSTDTRIVLDQPLQSTGSIEASYRNAPGFLSGLLGLGFHATDRLYLNLQLERGLRVGAAYTESERKRGRLGLTANYRLLGGAKRKLAER
ncbi:hypothetical protein QWY85_06850 [Neolewinella lacunae]|uniref:Uncharacterized protein n=1 Tax=Neolewinella lacunae TaxID=1517758 RepID=A0A923PQ87_9BACT|nr:hypothetical protein [Neolewinella lacunae]MBC6994747.1 hypothetical protein [Neolewinella lacunae]MDN3634369.1 hypothetical protein [Neolewinella lacunae]